MSVLVQLGRLALLALCLLSPAACKVQDRVFLSKCLCADDRSRPVCDFAELSKRKLLTLSEKLLTSQIVCVAVGDGEQRYFPSFTSLLLPLDRVLQPGVNGAINIDGVLPQLLEKVKPDLSLGTERKRKKKQPQDSCGIDGLMCSSNEVRFLFPSPVLVEQIVRDEKTSQFNQQLKAILLGLEEKNEGCPFHLHGGYRSKDGLLDRADPAIAWLKSEIVPRATRLLGLSNSTHLKFVVDGWGQVLRAGDGQGVHVHPGSMFAGVYHVSAPNAILESEGENSSGGGGCLRLLDPRPGAQMAQVARGKSLYGDSMEVCPGAQGGTLIMFPPYLPHEVPPMPAHVKGPRIAISFNIIYSP